jgi:hypothetical protein
LESFTYPKRSLSALGECGFPREDVEFVSRLAEDDEAEGAPPRLMAGVHKEPPAGGRSGDPEGALEDLLAFGAGDLLRRCANREQTGRASLKPRLAKDQRI